MALTADTPLTQILGSKSDAPVAASSKIYEGSMLGDSAGYVRALTAGDKFRGHSLEYQDNSSGSAGDLTVEHLTGRYRLKVTLSGVTITGEGQPVYASDDGTLTFVAVSNSYVGVVVRYVTTNTAIVEFKTGEIDEFGPNTQRETKSANYTVDAQDSGKIIYVDTDAKTITLPAVEAGITVTVVNAGSFGTVAVTISPNAADMIEGVDLTGADNKDIVNTKATAQRGDFVTLVGANADGWMVQAMRGTWAREA